MSFFRRKQETKPENYNPDEIKKAVDNPGNTQLAVQQQQQNQMPMCAKHNKPLDQCTSLHVYRPEPTHEEIAVPDTAPLFVKIDKYKEIIASVNDVKRFLTSIKQLFLVMNELQGIQQDSINMLKTSVQRLEKSIEWVDHSLVRPIGFEEPPHGEAEVRQIEQSLLDLQKEIANLRKDLEKLS